MAEKLRLTINILEDLDRIQVASGLDRSHFMQDLQALGVAMGLGLQATGVSRANVNLMPSGMQTERLLASKRWAAVAALGILGAAMWTDYSIASGAAQVNAGLATKVTAYAKENRERMKDSKDVLEKVQQLAPQLAAFDVVGANQGLAHAVLGGVTSAVQGIALTPGFRPPAPTLPAIVETTPALQGAYLRKIDFGDLAAGGGSDPFRPLATARTVSVQIDIPAGPSQGEVRSALLKTLRELPMPAHLQDLAKAPTLFTDVQATSDIEGVVSWYYLDRDRLDEQGSLKPIEEKKTLATSTTTYTCTIAAVGGEAAQ